MTGIDTRLEELGITPIRGQFVPATTKEVEELAARLGHVLPPDYEHYVRNYGYARFDDVVSVPLPGGEDEAPIAVLFGGRNSGAPLLTQLTDYEDQLPGGFLPIARDPFGNLFLLEVAGTDAGRVWYAVFDDRFHAVPVANSFEAFLDALTADPEDEG